ncbi:MAG: YkgJ family cysteine cluster protein [Lentisphaeria bacterium]|nr:YkgJ family cysteine cluster protein [Lentisphaeria bacterium]
MACQVREPLPCAQCNARCCRYMAIKVDTPRTADDYDDVRWYLLHRDVRVLVDTDGIWYVAFDTPCERIGKDGRCLQYDARPQICRDYPKGNPCEGTSALFVHDFNTVDEFDGWLQRQLVAAEV